MPWQILTGTKMRISRNAQSSFRVGISKVGISISRMCANRVVLIDFGLKRYNSENVDK